MDIKHAAELLGQIGIQVKATDDSIYEIPSYQDDNIYKLEKRGGHWVYLFIEYERGIGKKTTIKIFQSETEASIYFLLVTFQDNFYRNYIFPNRKKNSSLNIGNPRFTFADLQKALRSLPIDHVNYSFFDEPTVPYSIHL